MRNRLTGLWQQPEFMKLWTGQTISRFGSHIGGGALRYTAILFLGATPLQLSILTISGMFPALLIGLFAGVWIDRMRRRPVLIITDLARAFLLFTIPLAYVLGLLRIEQLYIVAALVGMLSVWFDVAYQAFLPSVVKREQLVEGNSKLGMSDSVAEIAGPPIGGVLVQAISAPLALGMDAFSFLFSAIALWKIRSPETIVEVDAQQAGIVSEMREGLRAVLRDPVLRVLLLTATMMGFAGGIIGTLYDLYLIRDLGMSPAIVGLTIGIGGIGAFVGAFLAGPFVERFGLGITICGSILVSSIASFLLPLAAGPLVVALPLILLAQISDVARTVFSINELSLRQTITPDQLLGRMNATFNQLPMAAGLLGTLAGGLLGQTLGLRAAIAIGVFGVFCASISLLFSPIRRLRGMKRLEGKQAQVSMS